MQFSVNHFLELVGSWIKSVISSGGYPGIAALMALESACVPLPSEVVMPFAGALTLAAMAGARAPLNIHLVAVSGALGCALGSAAAYLVGASAGREFVLRYGRFLLIRRHDVDMADAWFQRWGGAAVFIARLLPVVRTFISLPAGISRMPFRPFIVLSFLGSLPWCYLLAYVGVQFAAHLDDLKRYFHGADGVIGIVVVAAVALYIWRHVRSSPPAESAP